jgi:hypothetical protein
VPLDYGITRPDAFSCGPIMQHQGTVGGGEIYGEPTPIGDGTLPEGGEPEMVPAPPVPGTKPGASRTNIEPAPVQTPRENTAQRFQSPDPVSGEADLPSRRSSVRFSSGSQTNSARQ